MKRLCALTLVAAMIFALCSILPAEVKAAKSGYYTYTVSNNQATITGCDTSISGAVTIPATLGGYPVVAVGSSAFSFCNNITSVTVPGSVTKIGSDAFKDLTGLTSVTLQKGVKTLGLRAFGYCSNLKTVVLPDGLTTIFDQAFINCTSLTSITIPGSVTEITSYAFAGCSSLKSLTICEGVDKKTGTKAFYGCTNLSYVEIQSGITELGEGTFENCTSLGAITIPESITYIRSDAFDNCTSLSHVAYTGTQSQWDKMSFGFYGNRYLTDATRHCNTSFQYLDNCVETSIYCPVCQKYLLRTTKSGGKHTYQSITDTSCDVCSTARTLTSVSLATLPTKLQYNQYEDSLNVSGGQLRLTYSDGASGTISMTSSMVSGFNNTVVGTQTLTVTYKGKTATYQIEVLAGVNQVEIITLPDKLYYLTGESVDLFGLTLLASYKDGRQKTVTAAEVSAQANLSDAGIKTVTVTYQSVQTSFQVYVHESKLETVESSLYPESSHNYSSSTNETKTLTIPGAAELILTFNSSSATESNYDYVYILDGSGNQIGKYSGSLANKVVTVPGDTVKIRLTSDGSVNKYGYAFSKIEASLGILHPEITIPGCAPTCTETGLTAGAYCEICGQITIEQQMLPMLEHTYVYGECTACGDREYFCVILTENTRVDMSLEENLYVELNGHDLSGTIITNGFKVYGMDSTTDDYTCENIGSFACVDENGNLIVPERICDRGEKRYMAIRTEDRYSFHRFFVGITHMTLAPETVGLGYKTAVYGDKMVFAELAESKSFSFKLQLEGYNPVYRYFDRNELTSGEPITLRIRNYDVENYSEHNLYAQVSLTLNDGTVIEAEQVALTFRWLTEQVNANYTDYTADQLASFKAMLQVFDIVKKWDIPNLI